MSTRPVSENDSSVNRQALSKQVVWNGRMISPLGPEEGIDLPMLEALEIEPVRKPQLSPRVESLEAPRVKPEKADQDDSIKLVYKSFEKERISFRQFIEIYLHEISEWERTDESSPEGVKRLVFCKALILDLIEQIKRIRQDGCDDANWDLCGDTLVELGSLDNGKMVYAELRKCLADLVELDRKRMALVDQKLFACMPTGFMDKSADTYSHYFIYNYPRRASFDKRFSIEIKSEDILKVQRKSFCDSIVKLRMVVIEDLVRKIQRKEAIFVELDLLYRIVKPMVDDLEALTQDLEREEHPNMKLAAEKLTRMKNVLHGLVDDPRNAILDILRFEELDKERQILQLKVWQDEKKGT
jgi:hypothetical protein